MVVVLPGSWNAVVRRAKLRSKARNYTVRLPSSDSEYKESVMTAGPAPREEAPGRAARVGRSARREGTARRPGGRPTAVRNVRPAFSTARGAADRPRC